MIKKKIEKNKTLIYLPQIQTASNQTTQEEVETGANTQLETLEGGALEIEATPIETQKHPHPHIQVHNSQEVLRQIFLREKSRGEPIPCEKGTKTNRKTPDSIVLNLPKNILLKNKPWY